MNTSVFNVQYNIPRYNLALPGRQPRGGKGDMRITPGMTEAFEFHYGNFDGVPINLNGFKVRLVFWTTPSESTVSAGYAQQNIHVVKDLNVVSPYEGKATIVLTEADTLKLGQTQRSSVHWSVFLINDAGEVFPTQVTQSGERHGICRIESKGMPIGEIVRSLSPDK